MECTPILALAAHALGRCGFRGAALAAFTRSQEINPRHLASGERVRAAERIEEVRRALRQQAGSRP